MRQSVGDQITDQYTVKDAARHLGISENAVMQRIKRGTLSASKHDGRWIVVITSEATDHSDQSPTSRTDHQQPAGDHEPDWSTDHEATSPSPTMLALSYQALAPMMERVETIARENGQLRERLSATEKERDDLRAELARRDANPGPVETATSHVETSPNRPGATEAPPMGQDTLHQRSRIADLWRRVRRNPE